LGVTLLVVSAGAFPTRPGEIALDGWVLGFPLVVSIGMALLSAWAPRLTFMSEPTRAMGAGGRSTASVGRRRAQRLLVVSQLAASFMLLIGAGLLTHTL